MSNNEAAKAKMDTEVLIDGKKYRFQGTVDFSNLTIKKIDDNPVPDPDPTPGPDIDPIKPIEGTIKPGGWGADLVNKSAWKVVNMKNPPEQFKVVDAAGKNVATSFTNQQEAEGFITYFQLHEFPPKDINPVPTPGPTPEPGPTPTPDTKELDSFGVKKIYPDADSKRVLTNPKIDPKIRHYASGAPDDNSIECTIDTKDKSFRDMEATVVIKNKGMEHHDRFSYKLRGPAHKDNQGWWYIFETSTDGKWTNESFQIEKPHPKYFKYGNKITPLFNIGQDLRSANIGIKAITVNRTVNGKEGVHLEQWVNLDPLTTDGKPKNEGWQKYMEVDDVGQFDKGLMLECEGTLVTMRIDGILSIKDEAKMPEFLFTSVREVKNQ